MYKTFGKIVFNDSLSNMEINETGIHPISTARENALSTLISKQNTKQFGDFFKTRNKPLNNADAVKLLNSSVQIDIKDSNRLGKNRSYIPSKGGHNIIKLRQSLNTTLDLPGRSVINTAKLQSQSYDMGNLVNIETGKQSVFSSLAIKKQDMEKFKKRINNLTIPNGQIKDYYKK